jgi:response regulator RpfG family c-di-GMP phosphodiesterase
MKTILVVDDSPDILSSMQDFVQAGAPGYEVVAASNGYDALQLLRRHDVVLIISDFDMPRMDGAEFLALARTIKPAARRVILTGRGDYQAAKRSMNEGGADAFLEKPLDPAALVATIEKLAGPAPSRAGPS